MAAAKYPPRNAIEIDSLKQWLAAAVVRIFALTLTHIPAYPEKAEHNAPRVKLNPEKIEAAKLLI